MPSSQRFLFVNKNANSKSLTQSQGQERFQILSHVQPDCRLSCHYPRRSASKSSGPTENEGSATFDVKHATDVSSAATLSMPKPRSRRTVTLAQRSQNGLLHPPSYTLSPLAALGIADFDPFETTAAPIDEYMGTLLTFCKLHFPLQPSLYANCKSDGSPVVQRMYPTKYLMELSLRSSLSLAWECPVVLNALLSTTSAGLHVYANDPKHSVSAMYFKGQAICHLKHVLSHGDEKSVGISLAYAISLLLGTEVRSSLASSVNTPSDGNVPIVLARKYRRHRCSPEGS